MKTLALVCLALAFASPAYATDGNKGRPSICADIPSGPRADRCHQWVQTVKRPDFLDDLGRPYQSCCGEADLWIADKFETAPNGDLIFTITEEYPASPPITVFDDEGNPIAGTGTAFYATKGDKIVIPREKLVWWAEDANRSPHGYVFMRPSNGEVLCAGYGVLY